MKILIASVYVILSIVSISLYFAACNTFKKYEINNMEIYYKKTAMYFKIALMTFIVGLLTLIIGGIYIGL